MKKIIINNKNRSMKKLSIYTFIFLFISNFFHIYLFSHLFFYFHLYLFTHLCMYICIYFLIRCFTSDIAWKCKSFDATVTPCGVTKLNARDIDKVAQRMFKSFNIIVIAILFMVCWGHHIGRNLPSGDRCCWGEGGRWGGRYTQFFDTLQWRTMPCNFNHVCGHFTS